MKRIPPHKGLLSPIVISFIMVVLLVQITYLVLVRPLATDPNFPIKNTKLISGDVLSSTNNAIAGYYSPPITLSDLLGHRKDHTHSVTLLFIDARNLLLAQNFLLECKRYNLSNYVLFSLDNYTTCEKLEDDNCYFDASYDFSTKKGNGAYRINITTYLLDKGYNIFLAHEDVLLSDNPLLVLLDQLKFSSILTFHSTLIDHMISM